MVEAFLWGAFTASSLLLAAAVVSRFSIPRRVIGLFMGFGAGALFSAVAYELVLDSSEHDPGATVFAGGILLGAIVFYAGDVAIERKGRTRSNQQADETAPEQADDAENQNALAIALGTVLDGIPESAVIGASLASGGGVSAAMVAAAFISNVPESLGASYGLERAGMSRSRVYAMWVGIVLISGLASLAGFALLSSTAHRHGSGRSCRRSRPDRS